MKYKCVWLIALYSHAAFAVCEGERKDYTDWNSRCETLSASSVVAGTVGGIFAIVTFGISMAPCTGLSIAAFDACAKKRSSQEKLKTCENTERLKAQGLFSQAEALIKMQAEINELGERADRVPYAYCSNLVNTRCDADLREFLAHYVNEGWDMESDESKAFIDEKKKEIEEDRIKGLFGCANSREAWIRGRTTQIKEKYGVQ